MEGYTEADDDNSWSAEQSLLTGTGTLTTPEGRNNTVSSGRVLSEEFAKRGLRRLKGRRKLEEIYRKTQKVGTQLWGEAPPQYTKDQQFTSLRYTAVVSQKPIQFTPDGYRLQSYEKGYRIKCFTVVTMYNEDEHELQRTLRGICFNLQHMCQAQGPDFWKKFCVCVMLDGREKANKTTLQYAEAHGFFDHDLVNETVKMRKVTEEEKKKGKQPFDVRMHLFEYTAQLKEDENFEQRFPPLQIIFALKEFNGGKLDSHLWFFNAFADQLNPKYTFLLDVGTQPRPRAIWKLYRSMETNSRIAGVCGEIAAFKPNLINPVQAAQHFEYKISHVLDKALEASFGFISVLPGAFSGYRFDAIRERESKGPLVEYFQSITTPKKELGAFKANMYLAEDRILCFEIVARKDHDYLLHYVKNAVAETDIPGSLDVLIKQRRRWLNGSFFATLYTLLYFNRFWKDSTHSVTRKLLITSQFMYYAFNLVMNWLLPANFYLAFYFLTTSSSLLEHVPGISIGLNLVYVFLTLAQFVMGLGNTPDEMKQMYLFSCLFYGLFSFLVFGLSIYYVSHQLEWICFTDKQYYGTQPYPHETTVCSEADVRNFQTCQISGGTDCSPKCPNYCKDPISNQFVDETCRKHSCIPPKVVQISTAATVGCYFIGGILHGEIGAIASSFLQYIFMMPTFFNIFSIYSFCNIHDISWGTKGSDKMDEDAVGKMGPGGGDLAHKAGSDPKQAEANRKQAERELARADLEQKNADKDDTLVKKEFKAFRSSLLLSWIFSNAIFVYIVATKIVSQDHYLPFLFLVAGVFTGMRFLGSCYYLIHRYAWLGYRKIVKEHEMLKQRKQHQFLKRQESNYREPLAGGDDAGYGDMTPQEAEFV